MKNTRTQKLQAVKNREKSEKRENLEFYEKMKNVMRIYDLHLCVTASGTYHKIFKEIGVLYAELSTKNQNDLPFWPAL